jgi:hypothetical protein
MFGHTDNVRDLLFLDEFFLVTQWTFSGDEFEILVKAGEIIEPAFKAQLFDAHFVFYQQLAGIANPHFNKELGKGFAGL